MMTGGVHLLGNQTHNNFIFDSVVSQSVDLPPTRGLNLAGDVEVLEDDVTSLVLSTPPLQVNLVNCWPQGKRSVLVNCIQNLQFDLREEKLREKYFPFTQQYL